MLIVFTVSMSMAYGWREALLMKRFAGKTALITGAARGIGSAFAQSFVDEGAEVCIADIDLERAQATASQIGAHALHLDVTDQASIEACVASCAAQLGAIDILINNAALFDLAPIVEITRESYDRLFAVNVSGALFMMQAVARQMIAQNATRPGHANPARGGKIINMASQAGRRGEPLVGVYCATKAAIISLTQSAGLDLIKHGINVNAIAPGVVDGEHWDHVDALFAEAEGLAPGEKKSQVAQAVPAGRMGTAADLTGMALFLASADADYVVAQTYNVDGGNWMS